MWVQGHLVAAKGEIGLVKESFMSCIKKIYKQWYLFHGDVIIGIKVFQQRPQSFPESVGFPHRPLVLEAIN